MKSLKTSFSIIIGAILTAIGVSANATRPADNWQTTCGDVTGVDGAKYCFHQTGPNPQYTIWFFHGALDSEKVMMESPLNQDSYIEFEEGLPSVNVVTVSYGISWMLTDYPNRKQRPVNATIDVFTTQIMPFIENKFHPAKPYVAMGHSEGGVNVAKLCTAVPDLWSSCVLLNPVLPTCNPFAWFNCNHPGVDLLVRANYNESGWNTTQPMVAMKSAHALPRSFVTACKKDEFRLYDGPKAWSDQANAMGFNSQWTPVMSNCDHLHWPAQEVLKFLGD